MLTSCLEVSVSVLNIVISDVIIFSDPKSMFFALNSLSTAARAWPVLRPWYLATASRAGRLAGTLPATTARNSPSSILLVCSQSLRWVSVVSVTLTDEEAP